LVASFGFPLLGVAIGYALWAVTACIIVVLGTRAGLTIADGALCRMPAREQLNLFGHGESQALFFLETRIVGRDAAVPWISTEFSAHAGSMSPIASTSTSSDVVVFIGFSFPPDSSFHFCGP
jgi:hypothetical protein